MPAKKILKLDIDKLDSIPFEAFGIEAPDFKGTDKEIEEYKKSLQRSKEPTVFEPMRLPKAPGILPDPPSPVKKAKAPVKKQRRP
jgi:hypothetical protein